LLPEPVARLALRSGLDDAAVRLGTRPRGVWTPECAVSPEVAELLAAEGVTHTLVDEATLHAAGGRTDDVWLDGDLAVVGRDLELTDRVWSARAGYPSGAAYRDFHRYDADSGIRSFRVTDPASDDKEPYDPVAAAAAARRDAEDFVAATVRRLADRRTAGEHPLAVVAWDTELFGHWWHEGPLFLDHVLRLLPEAGVRSASLRTVVQERRDPRRRVRLPVGSWGAGKDLHLWSGPAVADLARDAKEVAARLLDVADRTGPGRARRPRLDAIAREALLALSSDWAFMVSRDSAAHYARRRHREHVERFLALSDGEDVPPLPSSATVVPHLDARSLTARTATAPSPRPPGR
jgi:1,4-alpha-glucan branching enzyme